MYITYDIFKNFDFIKHASSTRYGGVSQIDYLASMNLGFKTDDLRENVIKNYEIFCNEIQIPKEDLVFSSQFHNANIKEVFQKDRGKGLIYPMDYEDFDGLVTNKKNVALVVFSADCVPILFLDPKNKAIGAAHCGWRGTYKELAPKMIKELKKLYGSKEEDILTAICPSIKSCCYEVSEDLYNEFINKFPFLKNGEGAIFKNGEYYLDLPVINKMLLENAGVKHIEVSSYCTSCRSDMFFSHRKSGGKRGICAHMIELV